MQFVDEHFSQSIDSQSDSQLVLAELDRANREAFLLDFVAAVGRVVGVGVAVDGVRADQASRFDLDRASHHQFEPVVSCLDLLDFERSFSGPDKSLQSVGCRSQAAPTAVTQTGKQAAVVSLCQSNDG